ncbi:hypothetical protein B0H12DRAFT_135121 [Mycena haematopus]|nr:hypothetical protein B0H12DRAFT_135121 [Mycena haematopus]
MDQKLYIPNILDMIFASLGVLDRSTSSRLHDRPETHAAIARTCKALQNPALNALWATQTSLVPALRCFPDDLWGRSDHPTKLSFVVR